jgi:hypothetical protein
MDSNRCKARAGIEQERAAVAERLTRELSEVQRLVCARERVPVKLSQSVDQRRAERERLRMKLLEHEAGCRYCLLVEPLTQNW